MNHSLRILLFLLFSVFAAFVILSVFVASPDDGKPSPEPEKEPACSANETISCTIGSCPGTMECKNGEWGRCRIESICKPGAHYPCNSDGCSDGYKICNSCGTGFGRCITG
jgi:hypothetical protein